jgi:hypothetical protein
MVNSTIIKPSHSPSILAHFTLYIIPSRSNRGIPKNKHQTIGYGLRLVLPDYLDLCLLYSHYISSILPTMIDKATIISMIYPCALFDNGIIVGFTMFRFVYALYKYIPI